MIGPADFNDPEAWGYCPHCKFIVAVDGGVMPTHPRVKYQDSDVKCVGSDLPPAKRTPKEVGSLAFTYEPKAPGA